MAVISFRSTRSFRQFRAAVFGIAVFIRLAWGFVSALSAFSLTTKTDHVHQANVTYLFAINALAVLISAVIGGVELGRLSASSWTSKTGFELCWISAFLVLELIGAVMFTILRPFFDCDEIAQMGAEPGSWSTRKSTPDEIAMCRLSNQLAFYGVWTIIGLSILYMTFFLTLSIVAARRDRRVWGTPVFRFDWSITSRPRVFSSPEDPNPAMIQRPSNPQISKAMLDSSSSIAPVFLGPFMPSEPAFEIVRPPLNRHQMMAQYQSDTMSSLGSTRSALSDDSQAHNFRFSALGLDFDSMADSPRKHKPHLSIQIPPVELSNIVPVHAADLDAHEEIGFAVMEMPFTATISSDFHGTQDSEEPGVASSNKAVASHDGLPTLTVQSYRQSKAAHRGVDNKSRDPSPPVREATVPRDQPTIQQGTHRQSTWVNPDIIPSSRMAPQVLTPVASVSSQPSNILPLHQGDIQDSPLYAPYGSMPRQSIQASNQQSYQGQGVTFMPHNAVRRVPVRQNYTWPAGSRENASYYHHQKTPSVPTEVSMNRGFPFRPPPPPTYSPSTPAQYLNNERPQPFANQPQFSGQVSHVRSASTPVFYYHSPTAMGYNAGFFPSGPRESISPEGYASSTTRSRPGSAFPPPWSNDSVPGSRYVSPVTTPFEEPVRTEKRNSRKLRKSMHGMRR